MAASPMTSRRFLPLVLTQSLGAFNDNLFKNALAILALFSAASAGHLVVVLAAGIFILPYALFSSVAGDLADRMEKSRLIRATKAFEVLLMCCAAAAFHWDSMPGLLAVLFGLGVQATFLGPLKYGILPDLLDEDSLVAGNGLVEAGTFLGILAGTVAGGALVLGRGGPDTVSAIGIGMSLLGLAAAFAVPRVPVREPRPRVDWNVARGTASMVRQARGSRRIWLSVLGLSWFWTVGSTLVSEFPIVAKDTLHGGDGGVTVLLVTFALGIGAGSLLCSRILKGEVTSRHVPFAVLGISVFAFDLSLACEAAARGPGLSDPAAFMTSLAGIRVAADLFLLAACGGLFSVPLYAIIQELSPPESRSRMIAANNVVNAAFMVAGAVALAALGELGVPAPRVLMIMSAVNLGVAAWIVRLLPQQTMKTVFRHYFRIFHRAEVAGLEHYSAAGDRVIVAVNHLSFLDGCLVAAMLPDNPTFAMDVAQTRKWYLKPFLAPLDVFPVDPANPFSTKSMVAAVRGGRKLVIFPEGRITRTGKMMKVYDGTGMIADKADASVVTVHIDGLQHSPFARMRGRFKANPFPKVRMTVMPAMRPSAPAGLAGRARRKALGNSVERSMEEAAVAATVRGRTLFSALLDARDTFGAQKPVTEDLKRQPMGYGKLVVSSLVLGRKLHALTHDGEYVGVMLPNANGALVTFFALTAFGRIPAMLNVSAGADSVASCCTATRTRKIVCSRAFVAAVKTMPALVERLSERFQFIWLEDVGATVGVVDKLRGLLDARRARSLPGGHPDGPAVALYTSGSEGAPKGVVHSHDSILHNVSQLSVSMDFEQGDKLLNAMPMFHSFGLTGGTLLPVLSGVRTFFYPSPLHYRIVPEVAYDIEANITFGTDTFLAGWARFADPYDFHDMKYIFAGAEKVRETTRRTYSDTFGVRVLEGYGATETAPAIAINTPRHNRAGTCGRILPGMEWRLEPVDGIAKGGRLHVRGRNVMLGYMRATAPGVLEEPEGGWYDTGDVVEVDADRYVTFGLRAKRIAKIAGEMVSLPAAEALAVEAWPGHDHAVVSVPDPRKGEALVLVTTNPDAAPSGLLAVARARGTGEIMVPRVIVAVDRIPLLGTGKVDYPAVQAIALASRVPVPADRDEGWEGPGEAT